MSDSSESDVSSTYSSDGDVLTLFQRTSGSSPSSDESEREREQCWKELRSSSPLTSLHEDERTEILNILTSKPDTPKIQIFPSSVRQYLTQKYPHLVNRLSELPGREHSVVIATRNILTVVEGTIQKPAPKDALFDVCVFSPREPVLVLTITSGRGKKDRLTRYNSTLTRHILQHVRKSTCHNFSTVYGIIEDSVCQSRDNFMAKVKRLEQDAQVMSLTQALVMNQSKCVDVTKSFLELLPVDVPPDPTEASARQDDGHLDKLNLQALLKRIEELERAQTERGEQFDHVVAELQQMKRDYLTDIRLSLLMRPLMRPGSPPASESTVSGYGSTEVDTDILDIRNVTSSSETHRGTEKGDRAVQPKPQPELSAEDIKKGDLELVQYSRNITLYQASDEGKLDVVKYILSQEVADINCQGKWGRTPVMAAVNNRHITVFDYLVSQGCDLKAVDDYKDNVLHIACMGGSVDTVRKLVEREKCDIESKGRYGWTPVMSAIRLGYVTVFEYLVTQGCDLSAVDEKNNTVLHWACMGGNISIVRKLLDSGKYDVDCRGEFGRTPVMVSSYFGHRGVVDLLMSRKCKLTTIDDDRNTLLHVACIGGDLAMVKHILSLDIVSIESKGYHGRTPVMTAAAQGHRGAFDLLVSAGSKLTTIGDDRDTLLHVACIGGDVAMVKHILSLDIVSIESRGKYGWTPVMTAAAQGHRGAFDLLVNAGSKLTTIGDDRDTLLHVACIGGDVAMVKHILSLDIVSIESRGKYGWTPVMTAATQGHRGVYNLLVSAGSKLTTIDDDKNTLLHVACLGGDVAMVKHILSLDIVSIESRGKYGRTPVMTAAAQGHRGAFDLLVSAGSKLTTIDDDRNTLLHVACLGGDVAMVKHILSLDIVSIESRGKYGWTPVMTAAAQGHRGAFDLLVSAGSKLTTIDDDRNTLLHVACLGGDVAMVKHILSLDIVSIESRGKYGWTPVMTAAAQGHRGAFDLLVSAGSKLTTIGDDRDTLLHVACIGGDVDMVKHILSLDIVSIESRGKYGWTPVMTAAAQGHRGAFDLLVSAGSKLTTIDDDKNTLLHVACLGGDVAMVKHILSLDIVSIESRGKYGWTPVMTAAAQGHRGGFDLLVSAGSKLTTIDDDKNTLLHVACLGGDVAMVKHILSLDIVSIESKGYHGRTPVMTAAAQGHKGGFDLLVSAGSKLTTIDDDKNTLLHVACLGGDVAMVKHILSLDIVSIESRGKYGWTPVMTAATQGHRGAFDLLISAGSKLTTIDDDKNTLLHVACLGGDVAMVKHILSLDIVSIESRGKYGWTPVMTAATQGHRGAFDLLISAGSKLTTIDDDKNTLLHVACLGGDVAMVKHILSLDIVSIESRGKYGWTPVMTAAAQGHRGAFDMLVSAGSKLTTIDDDKNTLLHVACIGGDEDVVKHILSLDIVSIESRGKYGRTPVMTAAAQGHRGGFDLLVSAGSKLTTIDDDRNTLLHVACLGGDVAMVKHILSLDIVSIESRGKYGRTPVMTAAAQGHRGAFDMLVSAGSKLTTIGDDRDTLLHVACLGGDVAMVKHILSLDIVSIESRGKYGWTPVMTAAAQGHRGAFDLLVSAGSKLTTTDDDKNTLLHVACLGGDVAMVKHILSLDIVSIESKGYHGRTPVMTAAAQGHRGGFDLLVSAGSKLTTIDDDKNTLLHVACLGGDVAMVKHILSLDIVSIESRGKYGWTPVMTAAAQGHRGAFDLLVSAGSKLTTIDDDKNTLLHVACIGGDLAMVKHILSLDIVSIESKGYHGRTPVMTAAAQGHRGGFDLLVSAGSKLTTIDDDRNTLLHVACLGGDVAMVKHILSLDIVSIESRGKYGRTPVMTAAAQGHRGAFDMLVSAGSKLTTIDDDRNTLLHVACLGGDVDVVKHLLKMGVKGEKNNRKRTPVQVAELKGHTAVVSLLKAHIQVPVL